MLVLRLVLHCQTGLHTRQMLKHRGASLRFMHCCDEVVASLVYLANLSSLYIVQCMFIHNRCMVYLLEFNESSEYC